MIKSISDYRDYISCDFKANKLNKKSALISITWKYIWCLRHLELYINTHSIIRSFVFKLLMKHYSIKTGITIPINTFGKGVYIPHYGCIVVNGTAKFGDYCVIQCGVNISEKACGGNHIYFGAGSKVLSCVQIADNVIIGANAVVTKDIIEENTVWGGIPATKISNNGFLERENV